MSKNLSIRCLIRCLPDKRETSDAAFNKLSQISVTLHEHFRFKFDKITSMKRMRERAQIFDKEFTSSSQESELVVVLYDQTQIIHSLLITVNLKGKQIL